MIDEELTVKQENYEKIEDFDLNDFSISDEEDDENQNKSREINMDEEEDVGTRTDRNNTKPADNNTKQVEEVGRGTHMLKSSTLNQRFPFFIESKNTISFF